MPKFELIRDMKYTTWWRDNYEVEAETLEEAIKKVAEEKVDSDDQNEVEDCLERMTIQENSGNCTIEIFHNTTTNDAVWNNLTEFEPKPER